MNPPAHEHTYATEWSNDETHHWYAATCEHADEKKDYAEHTFGGATQCTVCSYKQPTEGLEYALNPDGQSYAVTGIGTATDTDIVIAKMYQDLPVTGIGEYAFHSCATLTSIVIPDGVTLIGDQAFWGCTNLVNVTIPESITSIGVGAFGYCLSLKANVYDSASYLGNKNNPYFALVYTNGIDITSCTVHENTKLIADYACVDSYNLTSITISGNVVNIGVCAVSGKSLTNITVDSTNPVYHSDGNCLIETKSKVLIAGCTSSVIPSDGSVTSIGGGAFYNARFTSITIPDGITSIGAGAFMECTNLTSITIPDSITSIGMNAFEFFTNASLTSIYYIGTPEEWANIDIGSFGNEQLARATCYYYSKTAPVESGNYWHYVEGVPTAW